MLGDIQAQSLLRLLNAQAATAKSLHHKHDGKVENEDDGDRDHNAQDLRDEQRGIAGVEQTAKGRP